MYLLSITLPFEILAFLNDGMDILGANIANQWLYFISLRYQIFILEVVFLILIAKVCQLFDLFDKLSLILQFGFPLI